MYTPRFASLWIILVCFPCVFLQAQRLPAKKEMLALMTLTNTYFMDKWPDPGKEITTNKQDPVIFDKSSLL